MDRHTHELWIAALSRTIAAERQLLDGILAQLSDDERRRRPAEGMNSVAVIVRLCSSTANIAGRRRQS